FFNQQINHAIQNQAARRSRFPVDEEQKESLGRELVLRVAVIALTVFLGCYALVRLLRARDTIDIQDPDLSQAITNSTVFGSIAARRKQALFGQDNHWETARQLARQCF